jgi:formyltetrahydrofolate hydrolase
VRRKLAPGPVVQQVVKVIEKEAKVEVDRAEASEMVKGALAKAVKKTAAKIVEEAVAE